MRTAPCKKGPAVVVPIDKLSILVSIAFGAIVFGERLSPRCYRAGADRGGNARPQSFNGLL